MESNVLVVLFSMLTKISALKEGVLDSWSESALKSGVVDYKWWSLWVQFVPKWIVFRFGFLTYVF